MRHTRMLGSAAAVGLCLTIPALPASAQAARPQPQLVSRTTTSAAAIELTGLVHDRTGHPLVGAVVSAIGSESAFAVSDRRRPVHLPHPAGRVLTSSARTCRAICPRGRA